MTVVRDSPKWKSVHFSQNKNFAKILDHDSTVSNQAVHVLAHDTTHIPYDMSMRALTIHTDIYFVLCVC